MNRRQRVPPSLEIIGACHLAECDGYERHKVEVESQVEEIEDGIDSSDCVVSARSLLNVSCPNADKGLGLDSLSKPIILD